MVKDKTSAAFAIALFGFALGGCGSSRVTAERVENAVAPTFANLIQTQETMLGLPPLDVSSFHASASCHRVGPGTDVSGSGTWLCTVEWMPKGHRSVWRDSYELSVTTDGCYTATADEAGGHLGGPRLTIEDGTQVVNLLYAFDGCFDTT